MAMLTVYVYNQESMKQLADCLDIKKCVLSPWNNPRKQRNFIVSPRDLDMDLDHKNWVISLKMDSPISNLI